MCSCFNNFYCPSLPKIQVFPSKQPTKTQIHYTQTWSNPPANPVTSPYLPRVLDNGHEPPEMLFTPVRPY